MILLRKSCISCTLEGIDIGSVARQLLAMHLMRSFLSSLEDNDLRFWNVVCISASDSTLLELL